MLRASNRLGDPREYFNLVDVSRHRGVWGRPTLTLKGKAIAVRRRLSGAPQWWRSSEYSPSSMQRYLDIVIENSMSPLGVFSAKLHWPGYEPLRGGVWDPVTWGMPIRWIHVSRDDRLRQAVSFVRAVQTDAWNSHMTDGAPPRYDAQAIAHAVQRLADWEEGWQRHFRVLRATPLTVSYEDLDADYVDQARRVLDHLGMTDEPVPPPRLARQADELTEEWVARFVAESSSMRRQGRGA